MRDYELLNTKTTLSPRRKSLEMKRSLLTGFVFFPLLFRGVSVHISFTFSSTMLQCLSNALTRARTLWLLRRLMSTCDRFLTAACSTLIGPLANSYSSSCPSSYSLSSERGRWMSSAISLPGRCLLAAWWLVLALFCASLSLISPPQVARAHHPQTSTPTLVCFIR